MDCKDFAGICSPFRSDSRPFIPIELSAGSSDCLEFTWKTGAGGENRTHDLPLTTGLDCSRQSREEPLSAKLW
jgi:hypothetical protein